VTTPPRRVVVTHPRTTSARSPRIPAGSLDRQADLDLDEVLLRSLIAAQLRLSLLVGTGAIGILLGLPLLILAVPAMQEVYVARVPVGWLALAIGVFPAVIAAGAIYVRAAERYERRYRDLRDDR
jgi:O-antigen ligase